MIDDLFTFEPSIPKEDLIREVLEDPTKTERLESKELEYLQEAVKQKKQHVSQKLEHLETYQGEGASVERLSYERTLSALELIEADIAKDTTPAKKQTEIGQELATAFEGKAVTQPVLQLLKDSFEEQAALCAEPDHPSVLRIKNILREIEHIHGQLPEHKVQVLIQETRQTVSTLIVTAFTKWTQAGEGLTAIARKTEQYVQAVKSVQFAFDKLGSRDIRCINDEATHNLKNHFKNIMQRLIDKRSFHPFMNDTITLLKMSDQVLSLAVDQKLAKQIRSFMQDKALEGVKITIERSTIIKPEREIHSLLIKVESIEQLKPYLDQEHQTKLVDHKRAILATELKQFIDANKKFIDTLSKQSINGDALAIMNELKHIQTFFAKQTHTFMSSSDIQQIKTGIEKLEKTLHESVISSAQKILERRNALIKNPAIESWQFFESFDHIIKTYDQLQKMIGMYPQFHDIVNTYQSFITKQDFEQIFSTAQKFLSSLIVKQPTTSQMKRFIQAAEQVMRVFSTMDAVLDSEKQEIFRNKFNTFYQTSLKQPVEMLNSKTIQTKLRFSSDTLGLISSINKNLEKFDIKTAT